MAEGGGIEPPTPYRVYGLAIRCITALPSLRNLFAPGRPVCIGAGALPSRMWRFGLSMRGRATAGTDMRSDPRPGRPQTFDLQEVYVGSQPAARQGVPLLARSASTILPRNFSGSHALAAFFPSARRAAQGTRPAAGNMSTRSTRSEKVSRKTGYIDMTFDLGRPFNDLPDPPAYCGGGGICIPRWTAGRLPTASNQRFTFG